MVVQPRPKPGVRAALAGLVSCLVLGLAAGTGRAAIALAVVATVLLAGAVLLERGRISAVLWAGVAVTAPMQGVRIAPFLALSDLLIIAALATIVPDLHQGWRRVVPTGVLVTFGVLVGAGLVGTFFAPDATASLANLVKIVLAAAGSVVAMALWNPGPIRLRQFAWLWFAGATISAAWAVATPRVVAGRAFGLTTHPNHFGLVCVLGVGLGLGLALSSTGRVRMAALAGVLLLTGGVGLSGSRAAVLGLAVTIGLTALLTRRFRLLVAVGTAAILTGMAVIVGIIKIPGSNALSRLGGGGGAALSDAERNQYAAQALADIRRHPFTGQGFEFAQNAHNIYLQVLVVGGPVALLSFLLVSGLIVRAGLRAVRAGWGKPNRPLLGGLAAGYVGYLCSGAFDNILWDRYLWTYVGLLIVLSASSDGRAGAATFRPIRCTPANAPGAS